MAFSDSLWMGFWSLCTVTFWQKVDFFLFTTGFRAYYYTILIEWNNVQWLKIVKKTYSCTLLFKEEQSGGTVDWSKNSRLPTWLGCFSCQQAVGYPKTEHTLGKDPLYLDYQMLGWWDDQPSNQVYYIEDCWIFISLNALLWEGVESAWTVTGKK